MDSFTKYLHSMEQAVEEFNVNVEHEDSIDSLNEIKAFVSTFDCESYIKDLAMEPQLRSQILMGMKYTFSRALNILNDRINQLKAKGVVYE